MTIDEIISHAITEDVKDGDHTSLAVIDKNTKAAANLLVKEDGILSGLTIAEKVFNTIDPDINFQKFKNDGDPIKYGDIVFNVSGKARSVLQSERIALNFMQRMCGIATKTNHYANIVKGTKVKIIDTRKTTPNMRILEKLAVKTGGGYNHRMGLYDMIMIKDNHIDYAGGIKNALTKTREYLDTNKLDLIIEIEVRSIAELENVLQIGNVDIIMLDNFTLEDTHQAINMINGQFKTEASGNITEENLLSIAMTGVNYISIGALTHHIKSLDLSLKAVI